jgi:hypothetical protein
MTFEEAIFWLDEQGGRWSTHASGSTVQVIVSLGGHQVQAPVGRLLAEQVRQAFIQAVQAIRSTVSHGRSRRT